MSVPALIIGVSRPTIYSALYGHADYVAANSPNLLRLRGTSESKTFGVCNSTLSPNICIRLCFQRFQMGLRIPILDTERLSGTVVIQRGDRFGELRGARASRKNWLARPLIAVDLFNLDTFVTCVSCRLKRNKAQK